MAMGEQHAANAMHTDVHGRSLSAKQDCVAIKAISVLIEQGIARSALMSESKRP